jgi:hypothetical protein
MVKIVSGYTDKGGSTTAFINLTNFLNENDVDCTFYGNQPWHLDKCKSGTIDELIYNEDDIVIFHFLDLKERPNVKRAILSCHEKWWFPVGRVKQYWDTVVFLHQQHRDYHSDYNGDYVIIPNLKENLLPSDKTNVFGHIGDQNYFDRYVKPLLIPNKVIHFGHTTNKQEMYNMVGKIYHSSKGEVACLVKDECYLTDTEFYGNEETENEVSKLTNDEVLNLWKNLFNI